MVFFEGETIEYIETLKKPITAIQVDMDLIPSPVIHDNDGGDDSIEDASADQGDGQPSELDDEHEAVDNTSE